jgi:hypothetical protein
LVNEAEQDWHQQGDEQTNPRWLKQIIPSAENFPFFPTGQEKICRLLYKPSQPIPNPVVFLCFAHTRCPFELDFSIFHSGLDISDL